MNSGARGAGMARLSFAAAALSLALLAALHVLSPEFDPKYRVISEYADGRHGLALAAMFACTSLSCGALVAALKPRLRTLAGRLGLLLLSVTAIGQGVEGVFDISHTAHKLAAMLGIPCLPLAALFISRQLRTDPAWCGPRSLLLFAAWVTLLSLGTFLVTVVGFTGFFMGGEDSGWPIGWANRLLMVAYATWLMIASRGTLARDSSPRPPDSRAP